MNAGSPINGIAPFFIVEDVQRSVAFYRDELGFDLWYLEPTEGPFFAMLGRGDGPERYCPMTRQSASRSWRLTTGLFPQWPTRSRSAMSRAWKFGWIANGR